MSWACETVSFWPTHTATSSLVPAKLPTLSRSRVPIQAVLSVALAFLTREPLLSLLAACAVGLCVSGEGL